MDRLLTMIAERHFPPLRIDGMDDPSVYAPGTLFAHPPVEHTTRVPLLTLLCGNFL